MAGKNKNLSDIKVMLTGFLLIVLVSGLFFLKNYYASKAKSARSAASMDSSGEAAAQNFTGTTDDELSKKINANEKPTVFDLRDANSFYNGHILDSKNVTLDYLQKAVSGQDASLDTGKEYVFVDDLGLTPNEIQALKIFDAAGFKNISYLEGGISKWENDLEPTITPGDPYSLADRAKVTGVKSDDLEKAISAGMKMQIIDVRSTSEFAAGHLSGAVNIPLDDLEARRGEIPLGERIILCDNNGVSAFQGGVRLFDAGIVGAYYLSDGLNAWKQKGYPLVVGK